MRSEADKKPETGTEQPEVELNQDLTAEAAEAPDYVLPAEDKEALAVPGEESEKKPETERDEVSPFMPADSVKKGKTKRYKMPNNEVVLPFDYSYRPMKDIERSKYSDKVQKCKTISEIRETAYAALKHHVLSTSIDGFDCSVGAEWARLRPGDIIEEILDAVAGQVKIPEPDLKNLLTG